jgi:hypothetical protein
VGAFNSLTFMQRKELLLNGFVMSNSFKTGLQYGLQPCIFSAVALELLRLYLSFMRPNLLENDDDPLFITFQGSKLRIGRFVTAFFKRTLSLNISTTTIRCIVETQSSDLLLRGEISQEARDSVLTVNGHSSITSKVFWYCYYCITLLISFKLQKYYQKRSRTQDVAHVDKVHRRLVASSGPSATSAEDKEDYAESECESDVVDDLFLTPVSSSSSVDIHQPHQPSGGFPHVNLCHYLSVTNIDFAVVDVAFAVTQCRM